MGWGLFLMRVVVKVGTSTLAHKTGCLNIRLVETLCKTLADLQNAGHQIVLVSSGAIGMGVGKLQLGARPSDMATKQAAAAVGQCELMYTYDKLFTEYNHTVAQVLLTEEDIEDKMRRHNVETTLQRLLQLGAIPVINENDTVSTAEIAEVSTLGDNDTLASIVAVSVEADLLVLDEAGSAWELDMVDKDLLRRAVLQRPAGQECVLTAHAAPQWMLDAADYVTEMKCIRHPYQKGIAARKGVEY